MLAPRHTPALRVAANTSHAVVLSRAHIHHYWRSLRPRPARFSPANHDRMSGGEHRGRPDDGLPAQRAGDPPPRRRALRRQRDREPPARQELAHVHVRRLRVAHEEAHRRAPQARPRGRRPRRDVHVEPLAAPRGVHGRAGGRLRHAHAEPPPPPRRQHVHRDARRRPRHPRRQGALAARRAVRPALQLRARHRGRRRPDAGRRRSTTRSSSPTRTSPSSRTATSRRTPRRRCATRAAPPAGRRASSTRTARSRSTR